MWITVALKGATQTQTAGKDGSVMIRPLPMGTSNASWVVATTTAALQAKYARMGTALMVAEMTQGALLSKMVSGSNGDASRKSASRVVMSIATVYGGSVRSIRKAIQSVSASDAGIPANAKVF